ncbi:MAG: hypothetical protein JO235_06315, partial [Chroococcidiopsidaceae cyanobacterium CP_BM_RX_35]|nr:hypothetical protein [Chroococcidiopsidaceae cyanobacterium CP_BM_RX_35]
MNVGIFVSALGGASVEFFETAAIAYAIGRSGYRREATLGTVTGLALVGIAAAVLGTELQLIPLRFLQIWIGLVLLWFGWGWVKKSVLRQAKGKRAGWITDPLGSEGITLETQRRGFSRLNFVVMVKSAALEGLEVAIIVTTLGLASRAWNEAVWGAALALALTVAVVAVLHGHLLKVPEVLIKLSAGVLLMAFGTFWLGEGLGLPWPFGDVSLLGLIILYGLLCGL